MVLLGPKRIFRDAMILDTYWRNRRPMRILPDSSGTVLSGTMRCLISTRLRFRTVRLLLDTSRFKFKVSMVAAVRSIEIGASDANAAQPSSP
jgi:hypothetical protein